MPLISVVLPAYNAESTIERAVASILSQTHTQIELIVIDDGSTDATASIASRISDPRLRVLTCDHMGVALATNFGVAQSQGSYIARMDADDFSYSSRLEAQVRLIESQALDVVGCQVRILGATGQPVESLQRYQSWINEETLTPEQIAAFRFVEFPLVNPTILARRRYFELGFEDNDLPEDYDLMLRAACMGMNFGKVPRVLLDWSDLPNRVTRNDTRYSEQAFMKCRRHHLRNGPLAHVKEVDVWGAGATGKPWIRWLESVGVSVRHAIEVNQRKVGERIHGVPVISPSAMPSCDGIPLVVAVGAAGARPLILDHIRERGYTPGVETWFVA